MKKFKFDYMDIIEKDDGRFVVYGYDTFPRDSVMAGQSRKNYLDSFYSLEEAQKAYPKVELGHQLMQPENTFDHLPEGGDL